ncbi:MAG TPA: GTP--adenosylcobinamide-phosphate guanylyltransferase, partial [Caulobacter sp.]|nr:GTP--adenosylcobinamide-phosphate guanylyltransferase [Caulobacter sp.]
MAAPFQAPFQALVLAGSRGGVDPVADYAGVSQKGLIVLGGRTLLTRVLDALDKAGAERIGVSTNDAAL